MTTLDDAIAEIKAFRDHFNNRLRELAAEGMPFRVVSDPSFLGFEIQSPTGLHRLPDIAGSSGS